MNVKTPLSEHSDFIRSDQYGIAVAPSGGIRLSPHLYNTLGDLDKVVQALVSLAV